MTAKRWEAAWYHDDVGVRISAVHVLPLGDSMEHEEGIWCPCRPVQNGDIIRHNAHDGREYDEPDFTP